MHLVSSKNPTQRWQVVLVRVQQGSFHPNQQSSIVMPRGGRGEAVRGAPESLGWGLIQGGGAMRRHGHRSRGREATIWDNQLSVEEGR